MENKTNGGTKGCARAKSGGGKTTKKTGTGKTGTGRSGKTTSCR